MPVTTQSNKNMIRHLNKGQALEIFLHKMALDRVSFCTS